MSLQEQTNRNLELGRRFALAIIANPALLDDIPDGVHLALIPDDDPELAALNIELGIADVRRGHDTYFRHVHVAALPH